MSRRFQRSQSKLPSECVRSLEGMCTEPRVLCQFLSRRIAVERTEAIENRIVWLLFHMGEATRKRNEFVSPRKSLCHRRRRSSESSSVRCSMTVKSTSSSCHLTASRRIRAASHPAVPPPTTATCFDARLMSTQVSDRLAACRSRRLADYAPTRGTNCGRQGPGASGRMCGRRCPCDCVDCRCMAPRAKNRSNLPICKPVAAQAAFLRSPDRVHSGSQSP